MLNYALFLINLLLVGGSQVLIWSQKDVDSLGRISLGTTYNQQTLFTNVVQQSCNDFNFVFIDVPEVTIEQLAKVSSSDETVWTNLRASLLKSSEEKLVNYDHNSGIQPSLSHCTGSVQFYSVPATLPEDTIAAIDDKLGEILAGLGDKSSKTVFILRSLSGLSTQHNVMRRDVDSSPQVSSDGLFVATERALFYAANITFQPLGIWRNDDGVILRSKGTLISSLIDNESYESEGRVVLKLKTEEVIKSGDEKEDYEVTDFQFEMTFYQWENSQWFTENYTASYKIKGANDDKVVISPLDSQYIASVLGYSYACASPWVVPQGKDSYQANLMFHNLQIGVSFDGGQNSTRFDDAVSCESVLGQGMVMGFIVTLGGLLVFFYAIIMFQALKNPVFGDKQIHVSQE